MGYPTTADVALVGPHNAITFERESRDKLLL
jgi:hypothetical protein